VEVGGGDRDVVEARDIALLAAGRHRARADGHSNDEIEGIAHGGAPYSRPPSACSGTSDHWRARVSSVTPPTARSRSRPRAARAIPSGGPATPPRRRPAS